MHQFLPIAYFQHHLIPFENAHISIATHALHYGTAVLGGIRGIPNPEDPEELLLFRLNDHCQRLSNSARYLGYHLAADKIEQIILDWVKANHPRESFYVRPLIYTSGLGIAPRLHQIEKDLLIYGLYLQDYAATAGVTCRISSWYRQEDRSLPLRGKVSAAYIASALAKTEAVESGFDEAIMMNSQGKISEASGMNIFLVRSHRLITPSFDQDILEGITRDSVLQIAKTLSLPVTERPVDKSELFIADEVFLCGTAAKITPVTRIENYQLPTEKPITETLRSHLTLITQNRDPRFQSWITKVTCEK
jgi:branched-chain amino acid aminotransferase